MAMSGSPKDRRLNAYSPKVAAIDALEPATAALSDEELRARTAEFKAALAARRNAGPDPSPRRP